MKLAIIGRSSNLLSAAHQLHKLGHDIAILWVAKSADHYTVTEKNYSDFAKKIGATFFYREKINSRAAFDIFSAARCDLGVSSNYPVTIHSNIINIFKHGILNAHPGALPRYKGNATNNWAILNGEKEVGVTVHYMDENIDTGDILLQKFYPLRDDTYIGEVHQWFLQCSAQLLVQAVQGIADGSLTARPQPTAGNSSRTYFRRYEDGRIDWTKSVKEIHRLIRAVSRPYSGAFTTLEGEIPLAVWRAEPYHHHEKLYYAPGQICFGVDGDPVVGCGDGLLRLLDIEAKSDPPLSMKDILLASPKNRLV